MIRSRALSSLLRSTQPRHISSTAFVLADNPPTNNSKSTQTDLEELPPNVVAAYLDPIRLPKTHGVPSCQLQLRSYDKETLSFFADFAMRAAYHLKLPASGPVPMPKKTERWTVPRGPFVHKKTQENFERITYKRMIKIADGHPEVVERWLSYLNSNVMPGVGMKANTYSFDSLGVGKRMQQAKTEAAIEGSPQEEREIPNLAAEKAKKILSKKEYQDPSDTKQAAVSSPASKSTDAQAS
ncbi:30S ribosomal protein S10,mitochondrial [Taphrina deformans PYCC 5710]|uniref:Small ribosomal subunit protein uS10m n=1 Tax=Taphrina deformans (strain PYCC 5710 / ATCC 11124 / CBS 356.35 / IMI 108563 / JCM 9778 / NBRC 8474) TaxID=1097556 RepID=R4X7L5_TAPDE|nr:30S ribosomal protein S10,mitochondrial [Taphrina deformans PYCC 5710]|eukprot:CCG81395.1 30S ribosomal protein S10,mitochondrial [Taphrina deformans PYCC 5710]